MIKEIFNPVKEPPWFKPSEASYFYASRWKTMNKQSILDLGCGFGRHSLFFAKQGFKVTAVDEHSQTITYVRQWEQQEEVKIMTKLAMMDKLPFREGAFDCLWAYDVFGHVDTPTFKKTVKEAHRVLKAGGEFYLTLESKETCGISDGIHPQVDENTILKLQDLNREYRPHFCVGLEDIVRLLKGFEIISVRQIEDCFYRGRSTGHKQYAVLAKVLKEEKVIDYSGIIGQEVSGRIDRPLGSVHPKHPDIAYPVNYGYVQGVIGGDGQPQDIYYLGEDQAVDHFEGRVVGVIKRYNDLEDKWIVAKPGHSFSDQEILDLVDFQEQYFDSSLYR